ncbi:MAG TPA: thioredoxin [Abditibacteriaceae bacterium]|nr:thioredoxin [Abditibacteriaceae bacterium]
MAQVNAVGVENFEQEVMQSEQPVVVDFWGAGCKPCDLLAPVLEKVARKFEGQLKVLKCDVYENQELAMEYGVRGVPNLIFFKGGQVVNQAIGYQNENQLSAKIEAVLNPQ